jgi:gliding motility-associated-like protein
MLISTTDHGCVDTTIEFLDIRDDMNVFIPNTFTPNSDGVNDVFQVKGMGFKAEGFTMEVFDRWGHMVYFGRDVTKGWDGTVKGGTPVEGVYIYRIKAVGTNGEGRKEFSGHVTLIR